jgi:hypothetical protein
MTDRLQSIGYWESGAVARARHAAARSQGLVTRRQILAEPGRVRRGEILGGDARSRMSKDLRASLPVAPFASVEKVLVAARIGKPNLPLLRITARHSLRVYAGRASQGWKVEVRLRNSPTVS